MNITYTIARYESFKDKFLVAFNINSDNGDAAYIESFLTFDEINGKTSQEVCQLAYEKIKNHTEELKIKFEKNSTSIVGYQFIPVE